MPKYIKAVDAADKFSEISGTPLCELVDIMCAIHAADVAEVVHGEWVWDKDGMDWDLEAWRCSECRGRNANLPGNKNIDPNLFAGHYYCPNCGCKMDKEAQT